MQTIYYETDVLVIGGGLPGVCAAIASARSNARTILIEKSMTLGGNCGPEIGVHPSDGHRYHPYMAATGIVSEIIDAAVKASAKTNTPDYHYNICQQWDSVMSEALSKEGVTLLRRHYAHTPTVENGRITQVFCEDTATYKHVCINVKHIVIDASGDGNISAAAGASYRKGREAKSEYGERIAPEKADDITLGSSLVALVRKTDREVKFTPPLSTPPFFPGYWGDITFDPKPDETLRFFFPTESGGEIDTIEDDHKIYETLLGQLYSAWDRVKNVKYKEEAKNWELLWVSPKIGKRESRRFIGDYVLTGNDVEAGRVFDDAIAVGGFYTDVHYPNPENEQYVSLIVGSVPPTYTIPYRSIYSKDIDNLMFASRLLSVSHLAHASVRVQRTLSSIAHAAGSGAGMCVKMGITPRQLGQKHIKELQNLLLSQDACIPLKEEKSSLVYEAEISASSELRAEICGNEKYIPIKENSGIQLWSFPEKIENVSFRIKSAKGGELGIKLLRYKTDTPWQSTRLPFGTFPRFETANETEWGLDNRTKKYELLCLAKTTVSENHCGDITFNLNTLVGQKDILNDEDKLMILFDRDFDGEFALSEKAYDFARFVSGRENDVYSVTDGAPKVTLSPPVSFCECANISNGYTRRFSTNPANMWKPQSLPATLSLKWKNPQYAENTDIYFDTIMRTYHEEPFECAKEASPQCAKDFEVLYYKDGNVVKSVHIDNNAVRKCNIPAGVEFDKIDIILHSSHSNAIPGIYKIDIK